MLTGYVCFGLALYASCALVAVLWMRRRGDLHPRPALADLLGAYGSMILFVALQTAEQIWDRLHPGHFPRVILRTALPLLYLGLGNSAVRLLHQDGSEETSRPVQMPRAEVKTAQGG